MRLSPPLIRTCIIATAVVAAASGCTQPKQTTAIGSATGGAIGAGLGAIVGNQTGSTGGGLAIGAVAGAATGALIGNALQAQQESVKAQDEALERQDRVIRAQRQEIEELRTINSDTPAVSSSRSSLNAPLHSQTLSPEAARRLAQLERRGPNPRGLSPSTSMAYSPPALHQNTEPLARYDVAAASRPIKKAERRAPAPSVTDMPKTEVVEASVVESDVVEKTSSGETIVESDIAVEEVISEPARVSGQDSATSPSCSEAVGEEQSAQAATENSQKLYHLRRALRLCPNSAKFHTELGRVYLAMDRKPDAQFEFNEALKSDAKYQAAQEGLAAAASSGGEKF
jgi:outer membrane lipoprotein SlyB